MKRQVVGTTEDVMTARHKNDPDIPWRPCGTHQLPLDARKAVGTTDTDFYRGMKSPRGPPSSSSSSGTLSTNEGGNQVKKSNLTTNSLM